MSRDLQLGTLTLILAAGYYAAAAALPESLLADAVGPQGLPKIYASVLAALALALIVRALSASSTSAAPALATPPSLVAASTTASTAAPLTSVPVGAPTAAPLASAPVAAHPASPTRSVDPTPAGARASHAAGRAVGMLLIGIGYVVAVPQVGYIPALAALITCTAAYQAREFTMRILAVGLAGAVLLWVLFVLLLGIPQPQGPWPSLF